MKKTWQQIEEELKRPFPNEDVEWRIQNPTKDKSKGYAVAYVTARAIQTRLDEVVGPENWKPVYTPWHDVEVGGRRIHSQLCTIRIYDEERSEWMEKTDGAEDTELEPVKGGLSDAMKRAAVQWGIGRYLYRLPSTLVAAESGGWRIAESELPRLARIHDEHVRKLFGAAAKAPSEGPPPAGPAYTVQKITAQQFKSGAGMILDLRAETGEDITVYLNSRDDSLRQGAVLCGVSISAVRGNQNKNRIYNMLTAYRVAA